MTSILKILLGITVVGIVIYAIYYFWKKSQTPKLAFSLAPDAKDIIEEEIEGTVDDLGEGEDIQFAIVEGRYQEAYDGVTNLVNAIYTRLIKMQEAIVDERLEEKNGAILSATLLCDKAKASLGLNVGLNLSCALMTGVSDDKSKKYDHSVKQLQKIKDEQIKYNEKMAGKYEEYRSAFLKEAVESTVDEMKDELNNLITEKDYPILFNELEAAK